MTALRRARAALLLLTAGLALTACGNANPELSAMFKSAPQLIKASRAEPEPLTPVQLAQSLGATPNPVALFELESRKNAQILLTEIERVGPYRSFGNQARMLVVMRQGMVTSSRGLGGDLMSSEEDALLALVASGVEGSAPYDMRFLTPEEVTRVMRFTCTAKPDGSTPVAAGLIQETGTIVKVRCEGEGGSFENTYIVASDGDILSSRQWMGRHIGYVNMQMLRR